MLSSVFRYGWGAAALVALGVAAAAAAQTANPLEPPGIDPHAKMDIAIEVEQLCKRAAYFEQVFLLLAAQAESPDSQMDRAIRAAPSAQAKQVYENWRSARQANAKAVGCGDAAMPHIVLARDIAYRELAAALIVAREERGGPNAVPPSRPLTPEEREVGDLALQRVQEMFPQDLPKLQQAAAQLIANRRTIYGGAGGRGAFDYVIDSGFAALRLELAAKDGGFTPRLRLFGRAFADGRPGRYLYRIELTSPQGQLISVAGPAKLNLPRAQGNPTTAHAALFSLANGALYAVLYGEEAAIMPSDATRAVLAFNNQSLAGTRLFGPDCQFIHCFRFAPEDVQRMLSDYRFDRATVLITDRADNARDGAGERLRFDRADLMRARQVVP